MIFAFLLDLGIGDPVYPFHPVRMMGKVIERMEGALRRRIRNERFAGALLALSLPAVVFGGAWAVIFLLQKVHPALAWFMNLLGIYTSISVSDLRSEAMKIYHDLGRGEVEKARMDLSRIVGRDTEALDQKGILRASIETVAESTVDGILAPLLYAAAGGAPLALAYKAVNTLDSMIGHLNERYRDFGFIAAKQDELWNWIPARISYYGIALASFFIHRKAKQALAAGWRDGMAADQGNSAIPEAAFAGSLGLELGGPSAYQGRLVAKPFLGFQTKNADREDLLKSIRLMIAVSWIGLCAAVLFKYALSLWAASFFR